MSGDHNEALQLAEARAVRLEEDMRGLDVALCVLETIARAPGLDRATTECIALGEQVEILRIRLDSAILGAHEAYQAMVALTDAMGLKLEGWPNDVVGAKFEAPTATAATVRS